MSQDVRLTLNEDLEPTKKAHASNGFERILGWNISSKHHNLINRRQSKIVPSWMPLLSEPLSFLKAESMCLLVVAPLANHT